MESSDRRTDSDFTLLLLTFNRDYVFADLILQRQVVDAFDQVVDGVYVRVDGLEPVDLGSDGRGVGQDELGARRAAAGLGGLARYYSPRAELTIAPGARTGRSGSELGRDGLGHRNGRQWDRAWSRHGRLRLLRDTGRWDARLEIHLGFLERLITLPVKYTKYSCVMQARVKSVRV